MTLAEIYDAIRLKTSDQHNTRFSVDDLRVVLNEACRKTYNKLIENSIFTNRQTTTVTISANTREADFTVDVQKVIYVEDANEVPIPCIKEAYAHSSRRPGIYCIHSGNTRSIGWYMTTPVEITLTVVYAPPFTAIQSITQSTYVIPEIPLEHHDLLVDYCAGVLLGIDEEPGQVWFNQYQNALDSMINGVRLEQDEPKEVVSVYDGETDTY